MMERLPVTRTGDSITQQGSSPDGGWVAVIQDAYARKVDVINRGYSGYTTRMARLVLPHVLPSRSEDPRSVVTIFFGANDAALSDRTSYKQHVPLDVYTKNVRWMVGYLRGEAKIRNVILITPPPVSEPHRVAHALKTYGINLPLGSERTVEATSKYAAACRDLAGELNVPCVDLFSRFMAVERYGDVLLNDGLHLTPRGNAMVAEALVEVLQELGLGADDIGLDVPLWDMMLPCDVEGMSEDVDDLLLAEAVLESHLNSRRRGVLATRLEETSAPPGSGEVLSNSQSFHSSS